MMKSLSRALVIAAFVAATPATASTIYFDLTGHDTANFSIDTSTLATVGGSGTESIYYAVAGTYEGSAGAADIIFFASGAGGGLQVNPLPEVPGIYFSPEGKAVIAGASTSPTFMLGTFNFTEDFKFGAVNDQLIVSNAPITSAVPEPTSWALMIGGLMGIGLAMRRAKQPFTRYPNLLAQG